MLRWANYSKFVQPKRINGTYKTQIIFSKKGHRNFPYCASLVLCRNYLGSWNTFAFVLNEKILVSRRPSSSQERLIFSAPLHSSSTGHFTFLIIWFRVARGRKDDENYTIRREEKIKFLQTSKFIWWEGVSYYSYSSFPFFPQYFGLLHFLSLFKSNFFTLRQRPTTH